MFNALNIINLNPKRLKELRQEKLSPKEIAKKCGISITQLYQRLHEYNLIKKKKCSTSSKKTLKK